MNLIVEALERIQKVPVFSDDEVMKAHVVIRLHAPHDLKTEAISRAIVQARLGRDPRALALRLFRT